MIPILQVVIGWGNASTGHGSCISRKGRGPGKEFLALLSRQYARVEIIDEFRTSQVMHWVTLGCCSVRPDNRWHSPLFGDPGFPCSPPSSLPSGCLLDNSAARCTWRFCLHAWPSVVVVVERRLSGAGIRNNPFCNVKHAHQPTSSPPRGEQCSYIGQSASVLIRNLTGTLDVPRRYARRACAGASGSSRQQTASVYTR